MSALRRRLAGLEGALRQTSIVERMPDDEKRDAVLAKYDRSRRGFESTIVSDVWLRRA